MKLVKTLFRGFAIVTCLLVVSSLSAPSDAEASNPAPTGRGHCCRSTYDACAVCCPLEAAYGNSSNLCFATLEECIKHRSGICYPCGGDSCG